MATKVFDNINSPFITAYVCNLINSDLSRPGIYKES